MEQLSLSFSKMYKSSNMITKLLSVFTILFCFCNLSNGQNRDLPEHKYVHEDQPIFSRKNLNPYGLTIGYMWSGFDNLTYSSRVALGSITSNAKSFTVGMSVDVFYPLVFNLGFFHAGKDVSDSVSPAFDADSIRFKHSGWDFSLNLHLLPKLKFASPYIGLGYQLGSLKAAPSFVDSEYYEGATATLIINSLMLNAGLDIRLGNGFYIFGEWRQSILPQGDKILETKYPYHQLIAGIKVKMN